VRIRPVPLILLALILISSQGCAGTGENGTGFAYILKEAGRLRNDGNYYLKEPVPAGPAQKRQDLTVRKSESGPAPEQEKKVYLTFDDGPDRVITPLILDILDSYKAKATFFVVGTNIEKNPEILQDIVKRGHAIGNHTYNHLYSDVYSGFDSFLKSIRLNEELIFRVVGQRPRVVRDPGGEVRKSELLKRLLAQNGYRLVDWNIDSHDSRTPNYNGPEIIESIRQQSQNKKLWPNMVIIMHDGSGHMNTVRALPTVLDMLVSQGFQFEVIK